MGSPLKRLATNPLLTYLIWLLCSLCKPRQYYAHMLSSGRRPLMLFAGLSFLWLTTLIEWVWPDNWLSQATLSTAKREILPLIDTIGLETPASTALALIVTVGTTVIILRLLITKNWRFTAAWATAFAAGPYSLTIAAMLWTTSLTDSFELYIIALSILYLVQVFSLFLHIKLCFRRTFWRIFSAVILIPVTNIFLIDSFLVHNIERHHHLSDLMQPTFHVSDQVLYRPVSPDQLDLCQTVVIRDMTTGELEIGRVLGVPGDHISTSHTALAVNGIVAASSHAGFSSHTPMGPHRTPVAQYYNRLQGCAFYTNCQSSFTHSHHILKQDEFLVVFDNRCSQSFIGIDRFVIKADRIRGRVLGVLWPAHRQIADNPD